MMTQEMFDRIEEIRRKLHDRRITTVAQKTGITYPKLWQFSKGYSKTLTMDQIVKLENYFKDTQ